MSRRPMFRARGRRGFTLVEILITMVMMTIIGAAVVSVFNSQQRFMRATADLGDVRSQLQTAAAVLPVDLRGISASGGDIIRMSDSSIYVRATVGSSIACAGVPGGTAVTLAPEGNLPAVNAGRTMRVTSFALAPAKDDSVFIWDEGPTTQASDDTWTSSAAGNRAYIVDAVNVVAGGCLPPYDNAGGRSVYTLQLNAATPLRASFVRGSSVRITRLVRYGIYRSAVDNKWYLGFWDPQFANYQYIAGPFLDYAATGASGARFRYYDNTGAEITNYLLTTNVARIVVTLRGRSAGPLSLSGSTKGRQYQDSSRIAISIRNRN